MSAPLTPVETAWLAQVLPCVAETERHSAEHWIAEAGPDVVYLDLAYGEPQSTEVILDGLFTYDQLVALVGIMRLRQEPVLPSPEGL